MSAPRATNSPFLQVCPSCGGSTAHPFALGGVCLRCAGLRALAGEDFALPTFDETAAPENSCHELRRLGSYEIIEQIGRGGMGVVYAARQSTLGRIVALKALPDTGQAAGPELRFLREAQTAARLRHPHIVAVHDSGRADGHVFFAMDYVEGGDLAQRLRRGPLAPRDAAALLHKIAGALAYTHGEGVLHRDLKPSNILLDGDEPRLADFGLAAQLEPGGDLTAVTGVLGTPHYLAPEALRGGSAALTAASDLYALGVIAYEMLAGRTPFAGASAVELPQLVDQRPPPSLRYLAPATPPDLETITLKLLEREPERRYASAAALAEDLRRFLAGEAILAQPPGAWTRLARYARRHRVAFAIGAAFVTVLLAATVISSSLAIRARRAEQRALAEAKTSKALSDFLQNDLLAQASPFASPNRDLPLRTVLDEAARKIDGRFPDQPEVEASIRETIATTYNSLGLHDAARTLLGPAHELRRRTQGDDHRDTLHAAALLATTDYYLANYERATPLARQTLARQRASLGPRHPETLQTQTILAALLDWQGELQESEALFRAALEIQRVTLPPGHLDTLESMGGLSSTLLDAGKFSAAETLLREMVALARAHQPPDSPHLLLGQNNLAGALWNQGKFDDALAIYHTIRETTTRALGPEHPDVLRVAVNIGRTLAAAGRPAEALPIFADSFARRRARFGPDFHDTLLSQHYVGTTLRDLGRLAEARETLLACLAVERRVLGLAHPEALQTAEDLADVCLLQADYAAAGELLAAVVDARRQSPADWRLAASQAELGRTLAARGETEAALRALVTAESELLSTTAAVPPNLRRRHAQRYDYLPALLERLGRKADADQSRARTASSISALLTPTP